MLINKILIVLVTVSSCLAAPEPKPDTEFNMNFHFREDGKDGKDGGAGSDEDKSHEDKSHEDVSYEDMSCGHDDPDAMCVMRQPYWGDCPSSMHFCPGSCHHHDKICCKKNPICGNDAQGQCYRTNATTECCPLPLFRQSARPGNSTCPDYGTSCCAEHPDPHCNCDNWGYEGMCGERGWKGLCPDFCSYDRQSPINIELEDVMPMPVGSYINFIYTDYDKPFININCENNGHFAVCHFDSDTITPKISGVGPGEYIFDHMEFHIGCEDDIGSEHTINNMSYSGELHLIHFHSHFDNYSMALHSGYQGSILVLGIFLHVNETQHSAVYNSFMKNLVYINKIYEEKTFLFNQPLEAFLPSKLDSFYYSGSLTYPSCNEVVSWFIFKEPAIIGNYQIRSFRCMMAGHGDRMCDNHRPTQPLNGREVYKLE